MRQDCLLIVLSVGLVGQLAFVSARSGEDQWAWRSFSRRERGFREKDIDRNGALQNSYNNNLKREPTTRKPLPGEPENDEIEDYVDTVTTVSSTPSTRQYNPYGNTNGFPGVGGQPAIGGQFGGQVPNYNYPNVYQPNLGGFGGAQNGLGLGSYPGYFGGTGLGFGGAGSGYPGLAGGAAYPGLAGGSAYPGLTGAGAGYPGLTGGLAYPGQAGQYGGYTGGQFPGANSQYPFGPYQGPYQGAGNYNNNQFAQYPGLAQYPTNQYGGAQYPEGYGQGQPGVGPTGYGGNFGFGNGFGYDEKSANAVQGKSAKSVSITPTPVDDKLAKKA